jgi:general nucleoside transport system permease protein
MSLRVDLVSTDNIRAGFYRIFFMLFFSVIAISIMITILIFTGNDIPVEELYQYAFRDVFVNPNLFLGINWPRIFDIIFWASPLVLTGLAVAIPFKAGLFNIGGQGQFMIGAGFATIWAVAIVPNTFILSSLINQVWFMIPTTIIAGFIGGALWGFVPGLLKARYGAHEVIVTILLNLIAISLTNYWFTSPSQSPYVDRSRPDAYGQSDQLPTSARLGRITEMSEILNWSIVIIIVIVVLLHILIYKTTFGYKLRAVGQNQLAAKTSGIESDKMIIYAMSLGGGLSGLAGTLFVMGRPPYRYIANMQSTFGFDGIAVSLIGLNTPLGILFAALFFGYLKQSRINLDLRSKIPSETVMVFQALIILFAASPLFAKIVFSKLRKIGKNIKPESSLKKSDSEDTNTQVQDHSKSNKDGEFEKDTMEDLSK